MAFASFWYFIFAATRVPGNSAALYLIMVQLQVLYSRAD